MVLISGPSSRVPRFLRCFSSFRNLGIFAHIDAGKTTLSERMLFLGKELTVPGNVDSGTTKMDYMPQERERGITIRAAANSFNWKNCKINLIDTPGHVDFTAEVSRCIRVLDGAVIVIDGCRGVQAQTITVWKQTSGGVSGSPLPRLIFINKLDREGAGWEMAVQSVRDRLEGAVPIPLQLPYPLSGEKIEGTIDLMSLKLWSYSGSFGKDLKELPLPEEARAAAEAARCDLLESLAILDEEFASCLESCSPPEPPSSGAVLAALRRQCIAGKAHPVLCGSALREKGVQPLLDSVIDFLPTSKESPSFTRFGKTNGEKHKTTATSFLLKSPIVEVFKVLPTGSPSNQILTSKFTMGPGERLAYCRVFNAPLLPKTELVSLSSASTSSNVSPVSALYSPKADRLEPLKAGEEGDVVVVTGLQHAQGGDLLAPAKVLAELRALVESEKAWSPPEVDECCFAVFEVESMPEEEKLREALEVLVVEDPSLRWTIDESTGQLQVWGVGELHLELCRDRLRAEFGLPRVKMGKMQVAYREHFPRSFEGSLQHSTIVHGKSSSVGITLRIGPAGDLPDLLSKKEEESQSMPKEAIDLYANLIVVSPKLLHSHPSSPRGGLPPPAALEAIREVLEDAITAGGPLLGSRLAACRVEVLDMQWETGSTVPCARSCASRLFRQMTRASGSGSGAASPSIVLEPVMRLVLHVEGETSGGTGVGSILSDITKHRRGFVKSVRSGSKSGLVEVVALVPLATMNGFAGALRSVAHGQASFTMEKAGLMEAPEGSYEVTRRYAHHYPVTENTEAA